MNAAVAQLTECSAPDWRADGQRWLDDAGVSHAAVAELVGSNRYQVDRWFKGESAPTLDHLQRMRDALPGLWMVIMSAHVWPHAIDTSATDEATAIEQARRVLKESSEGVDALMQHATAPTKGTADRARKELLEIADAAQRAANSVRV